MSVPQALLAERYRLIRVIAAGGMGVVWEAWDERLERPVAIKQLRTQPGVPEVEAELAKDRAMREARITARLRHPYAVPVYDTVEHEGQPCLIMPFLPSTPLSTVLRERGPLPLPEAVRIGAQIASALAAAHSLDIVHRDVKPGNILITVDGAGHISDFGISHAMGDATLTRTGMVYGTPAYLSPEMALGGDATFASDVFSFGATLYAAVEGAPPFGSDPNSIALLHKVAAARVPPPTRAGVLTPFLLDMLAREPEARPTMGVVASFLADLKTETQPVEEALPALPPYVTTSVPASGPAGGVDETTRPWGPDDESGETPVAGRTSGERTSSLPWRSTLRYGAGPAAVAQAAAAPASASAPAAAPPEPQDFDQEPEAELVDEPDWGYEPEPEDTPHPLGLGSTSDSETPPPARTPNRRGAVLAVAAAVAALVMLIAATLSGQFDNDPPGTAGETGAAPTPSSIAAESEPLASSSPIVSAAPVVPAPNPEPEPEPDPTRGTQSEAQEQPAPETKSAAEQEKEQKQAEEAAAEQAEADRKEAEEEAAQQAEADRKAEAERQAKAQPAQTQEEAQPEETQEEAQAEETQAAAQPEETQAEAQPEEPAQPEEEPEEPAEEPEEPTEEPAEEPEEPAEEPASADRASQLASAISNYYALMPGNTEAAWPRMTANYQTNHAGGRNAYENFWDDINDLSISNVQGLPPDRAEATLTYYFDDGRVVVERTSYRLVEEGGTLKIAASTVLSSTSG